ncbi:MAG: 16S rRNA (cytosine(1402)-N(4))-methyltransferase RsmH [Thermoleophilia bacterium]|nr:16S rRNA (cytosine(1402)-N(4))-methyltransferase RsmH [Thermoleophilia bacterium]
MTVLGARTAAIPTAAGGAPHVPVLLDQVLTLTQPEPGEAVIDCTFGAGGHALSLASRVGPMGDLVAIDRDPEAASHFHALSSALVSPCRLLRTDFATALEDLADDGATADIILMDLGLSSMQVDTPERGFSYSRPAALDMRMDPTLATTATDLVNDVPEEQLAAWFREYGEERYARQIARGIGRRRSQAPITTTGDLVEVIRDSVPTPALFAGGHPARRVFQALRIVVNDELGILERALPAAFQVLNPGGRLAVISFQSLEDRMVKRFMRTRTVGCICPPDLPVCGCGREPEAAMITPRAVKATTAEVVINPRAHSARLRVLAKAAA